MHATAFVVQVVRELRLVVFEFVGFVGGERGPEAKRRARALRSCTTTCRRTARRGRERTRLRVEDDGKACDVCRWCDA
eukprot:3439098-Rhodomonas_salina.1